MLNAVLALVRIEPDDRIIKEQAPGEIKPESAVKTENGEAAGAQEPENEDDEEEDEDVPLKEEIGWREVVGFIVMCVKSAHDPSMLMYGIIALVSILLEKSIPS